MRIGILTYHDEVNYGSLLQAYAMQTALTDMGHDVLVIDRWFEPRQNRIYGILHTTSAQAWIKWLLKGVWGTGSWALFLRQWRSRKFIRRYLKLTPYHFHGCKDAPKDLGLDLIVVGSDQVWHPNAQPHVYLLNELKQVPGIAYAASFGANEIPEAKRALYRAGFKNFKAIGIREKEGVEMARHLGVANPVHVVDPTLLVNPRCWRKFVGKSPTQHQKRITCYFLSEDIFALSVKLGRWARSHNIEIDFFTQNFSVPFHRIRPCLKKWLMYWTCRVLYPVHFRSAAGPREFLRSIASADCVFTNSFHALMFSIIFEKNIRIVKPTARMQEFSGTVVKGPLIMDTIEDAFASFERGESIEFDQNELNRRRMFSKAWLSQAIATCEEAGDEK